MEHAGRGLYIRGYDRSAVTAQITDLRLDSLRNDGIAVTTGFCCSGRDKTFLPAIAPSSCQCP